MTCRLLRDRVGDRGQRYEIRYHEAIEVQPPVIAAPGFMQAGEEKVFGWATTREGALEMAAAWKTAPSVYDVWIVDRHALTVRKLIAALQALPEADQDNVVVAAALEDDPDFPWEPVTNVGRLEDGRISID